MSETVPVLKDLDAQALIPTVWRASLSEIANSIGRSDYLYLSKMQVVRPISEQQARMMRDNIEEYGVHLADLPEDAWRTSMCQWMGSYWDALIDLFSVEEGASDLALVVRVFEAGAEYSFEVRSVHVP